MCVDRPNRNAYDSRALLRDHAGLIVFTGTQRKGRARIRPQLGVLNRTRFTAFGFAISGTTVPVLAAVGAGDVLGEVRVREVPLRAEAAGVRRGSPGSYLAIKRGHAA